MGSPQATDDAAQHTANHRLGNSDASLGLDPNDSSETDTSHGRHLTFPSSELCHGSTTLHEHVHSAADRSRRWTATEQDPGTRRTQRWDAVQPAREHLARLKALQYLNL